MKNHILKTTTGDIFYQTGGAGESLFFLHGNGEDTTLFKAQFDDFCPSHTVIAMDTRGHGRSDLGVDVLTFEQIARDVLAILDTLTIEKITVIGYSDGGNIGMYLATQYPERIKSLIIMGANYEIDALEENLFAEIKNYQTVLNQREKTPENKRKLNILNLMLDELAISEEDLQRIQAPVLVMAGEWDIIKKSHTESLAALIPNSEIFICPEGGHDFFVTNPSIFFETVTLFLHKLKTNEI